MEKIAEGDGWEIWKGWFPDSIDLHTPGIVGTSFSGFRIKYADGSDHIIRSTHIRKLMEATRAGVDQVFPQWAIKVKGTEFTKGTSCWWWVDEKGGLTQSKQERRIFGVRAEAMKALWHWRGCFGENEGKLNVRLVRVKP